MKKEETRDVVWAKLERIIKKGEKKKNENNIWK